METENRNELIELFGKLFGEAVANEIQKYDSRKVNEVEYSEDVKNIKRIIDISVENICSSIESAIESAKKEILERIDLDSKRLPDLPDTIQPEVRQIIFTYLPILYNVKIDKVQFLVSILR